MLKKKQIIVIVTIALVSFLMGTMLNINSVAIGSDDYGIPFDKIWEAIYGLQARVTSLEERQEQTETILEELQETISDIEERLRAVEERIPPTITVIGPWSGGEMDAFMPVLQAFEEKTGIDVEYKLYRAEDLADILPSMFAAETTPGDVIFMWSWFIKEKGQEGHILDVTDLINEADFSPGALDPVKVGDTLYGGSYTGKVKPGFWYRKSFFETYGLTPPETWDEFLALLDNIATIPSIVNPIVSGDEVGWPLSDITEHFLITFGGPQLHRDLTAGTVAWNSTQVRDIFANKLVPLLQRNFSTPIEWTTALDLWWNGDYGLYFMGSWITGMVDDPEDLGLFSLPDTEGLVFAADYFFIPAYTEHPEEAKELFKFLASEEAQSIQVAQGGHIATNIDVQLDAYPPVDRRVAEVMTGKEILTDLDDTIGGEFQLTFWEQLRLLWVDPTKLDDVLDALEAVAP
jgi:multiple sugar transport system substrate-binding protein